MIISQVLCLSDEDVAAVLTLEACIPAVEQAFASYFDGRSRLLPVVREVLEDRNGIFGIKSGYMAASPCLGLKAGGFWEGNRRNGEPPHQSVTLLFDPDSGRAKALLGANAITRLRTGAAGAIATKFLAPPASKRAAIIGCGVQGEVQTLALKHALSGLTELVCFDASASAISSYIAAMRCLGIEVSAAASVREAVLDADVVVTTTPSWEPIVESQWVKPGAHLSAIGADTKGKHELDPELFRGARVVVDDWEQAKEIGESQHAYRAGILSETNLYAELGELCAGVKPGRDSFDGITIFDATGIALQDLAAASLAMTLAEQQGRGSWVEL